MPGIHFTADPHFGHANIIQHCKRPFSTAEEMDERMVANWNAVVGKRDTAYILGDFAYRCTMEYAVGILKRLNGNKHIILGNHDELAAKIARFHPGVWHSIQQLKEIRIDRQAIVMCHYAMRSWRHDLRGSWHLFGHTHGLLNTFGKSMDVGVDCWNFFPLSYDKVRDLMQALEIGPHPGFEGYVPGESAGEALTGQ